MWLKVWRNWLHPDAAAAGMSIGAAAVKTSQKVGHRTGDLATPLPGTHPREGKTHVHADP